MLVLCSMVHELALLLFLPVVIFDRTIAWHGRPKEELLIAGAASFSLCLPLFGSQSQPGLISKLIAAGLSPSDAKQQVATSLHQGVILAAVKMLNVWHHYFLNGCLGIIYAGLPALMIMLIGWPPMVHLQTRALSRSRRLLIISTYIGACLGAVTLLAIAWDLARLVSFTTLTSLLAVHTMYRRDYVPARSGALAAGLGAVLAFTLLPIFNLYFDYARPLRLAMIDTYCPPCAKLAIKAANFYNRDLPAQERAKLVSDPSYGNGPL